MMHCRAMPSLSRSLPGSCSLLPATLACFTTFCLWITDKCFPCLYQAVHTLFSLSAPHLDLQYDTDCPYYHIPQDTRIFPLKRCEYCSVPPKTAACYLHIPSNNIKMNDKKNIFHLTRFFCPFTIFINMLILWPFNSETLSVTVFPQCWAVLMMLTTLGKLRAAWRIFFRCPGSVIPMSLRSWSSITLLPCVWTNERDTSK